MHHPWEAWVAIIEDRMRCNRGQQRNQNRVSELHNNHNAKGKDERQKRPKTDMVSIGMDPNRTNDEMGWPTENQLGNRGLI